MTWPADLPPIVVDSREQCPLSFEWGQDVPSQVAGLATGDYSVAGLEDRVALERKSLGDLMGCVGRGRDRFRRALYRLAALDFPGIVLECSLQQVAAGDPQQRSRVSPRAARHWLPGGVGNETEDTAVPRQVEAGSCGPGAQLLAARRPGLPRAGPAPDLAQPVVGKAVCQTPAQTACQFPARENRGSSRMDWHAAW